MSSEQKMRASSPWRALRAAGIALAIGMAFAWGVLLTGCDNQATNLLDTIVIGTVVDEAGNPLVGVKVVPTRGETNLEAITDARGNYTIAGLSPSARLLLTFTRAGYVTGLRSVGAIEGETTLLNVSLRANGLQTTVNGSTLVTLPDTRPDGANGTVILPAGSVVNTDGDPVTNVVVEISTGIPSDPTYTQTAPAFFLAPMATGTSTEPLKTAGYLSVVLKDQAGNILNLDHGRTATIRIPVDPAADPGTATTPLWRLDEETGYWVADGNATRVVIGGKVYYEATVSHFTVWVMAVRWGRATAVIHVWEVVDFPTGAIPTAPAVSAVSKLSGATVKINVIGVPSFTTSATTDADGDVTIVVPKVSSTALEFWNIDAIKPGYTTSQWVAFRSSSGGFEAWLGVKRVQQFFVDVKKPAQGLKVKVVQVRSMSPAPTTPPGAVITQTVVGPVANARVTATLFERQSGRRVPFTGATDAAGVVTFSPEVGVYLGEFTASKAELFLPKPIAYAFEPDGTAVVTIGMVDKTGAAGGG